MLRLWPWKAGPVDPTHEWKIPAGDIARHQQRRGRRFAYETIDPATTALLVVDLVTFFVETTTYAPGIVGQVERLAGAVRRSGGRVIWITPTVGPPRPWAIEFFGPTVAEAYAGGGANVAPGLTIAQGDVCVEKSAPSALFPGRSPVHSLLQEQGIETVVICGTVTNVCVEATARDAATLGYRTIVVGDACAGVDDASHAASLRTIYRSFGDVRRVDEVVVLLETGP